MKNRKGRLLMGKVSVRERRGRIVDFGEGSRLKSDLAQYTSLNAETINEIVKKTKDKLSSYEQPIRPRDIAATAHFVMVEMNLRSEGNKYLDKILERHKTKVAGADKIMYIDCKYCGIANPSENEKCSGCGAVLDRKRVAAKVV
jgi:hypothetical protein